MLAPALRAAYHSTVSQPTRIQIRVAIESMKIALRPNPEVDVTKLRKTFNLKHFYDAAHGHDAWTGVSRQLETLGVRNEFGGMSVWEGRLLYHLVAFLKCESVLEIGTHIGSSTVRLAAALRDYSPSGTLRSVDIVNVNQPDGPWRQYGCVDSPEGLVARLGMQDRVTFTQARSLSFLECTTETFDLILLDGDHEWPTVYREVPAALKRLRPGGVIVLHDYYPDLKPFPDSDVPVIEGTFRAIRRLRRLEPHLRVQTFGVAPWHPRQTTLALLTRIDE